MRGIPDGYSPDGQRVQEATKFCAHPCDQHYGCKRACTRGGTQDQVDQGAGKGHFEYPSIQENAKAYADRTNLSCVAVAECLPGKSGVSETLSPRKILYRHKLDFAKHCRLPFGTYCEVHKEPMPTNSMVTCSTPAIVLGPTGNLQGTYKFFVW